MTRHDSRFGGPFYVFSSSVSIAQHGSRIMNQSVVNCPKCKKKFRISAKFVDKRFECNQCGHRFKIAAKPRNTPAASSKPRRSPAAKSRPAPSGGTRPAPSGKTRPTPTPPNPTPRRVAQPRPATKPRPAHLRPQVDLSSSTPQNDLFDELYSVGAAAQSVTAPTPPMAQPPVKPIRWTSVSMSFGFGSVWQIAARGLGIVIFIAVLVFGGTRLIYFFSDEYAAKITQLQRDWTPAGMPAGNPDTAIGLIRTNSVVYTLIAMALWGSVGVSMAVCGIKLDGPSWWSRGKGLLWLLSTILVFVCFFVILFILGFIGAPFIIILGVGYFLAFFCMITIARGLSLIITGHHDDG